MFALLLSMIRPIPRANARVRDGNFSVEGLVGTALHGRTFGIIGLGQLSRAVAAIAKGFGCRVLAFDPSPDPLAGVEIVPLDTVLSASDIVSLHAPLTPQTRHIIDAASLARLHPGAILVNTSRGALVDTAGLIDRRRTGQLGGVCLDVYEEEAGVFYQDLSNEISQRADHLAHGLPDLRGTARDRGHHPRQPDGIRGRATTPPCPDTPLRSRTMSLATTYLGPKLKNPLVAPASPLNAKLDNLRRLEDAGPGAIVRPSLFQEQVEHEEAANEAKTLAYADSSPEAMTYFLSSSAGQYRIVLGSRGLYRSATSIWSAAPPKRSASPSSPA